MNSYFFKITKEERDNILDKHKHIYDGYVTNYAQSNTQPLYVQDYANDKNGITINNRGDVGVYRNMSINEMRYDGKSTGLFDEDAQSGVGDDRVPEETFESDRYISLGDVYDNIDPNANVYIDELDERHDRIGDGPDDLKHGTFGDNGAEMCSHCGGMGFDENSEEECEWCGGTGEEGFSDRDDEDFIMYSDMGEEETQQITESVNKSLDMFRRFRRY